MDYKVLTAFLVAVVILLSSCAAGREIYWNEAVQASTGEEFIVKRREIRRYVAEPFQKGGWLFQEASIDADIPGISAVHWETSLRPWLLDRARDGRWYLIAMRGSYASTSEYGLFDGRDVGPRFVFYRYRPGGWERILADDLPPEFTSPNLLVFGESIFEPHPNGPYWGHDSDRKTRFWNGDLLDLQLKRKVNVPSHPDSSWIFHLTRGWRLDHGHRQLTECVTGGPCDAECWKHGGPCRSVKRFEVGQTLGRPPKSPEGGR